MLHNRIRISELCSW